MQPQSNNRRLFDADEIEQARRLNLEGAAESLRVAVIAAHDSGPVGRLVSAYWVMTKPRSQTPRARAEAVKYGEDPLTETHVNACVWPWRPGKAPRTMRAMLVDMARAYTEKSAQFGGELVRFQ
jgi:hypothetical protein